MTGEAIRLARVRGETFLKKGSPPDPLPKTFVGPPRLQPRRPDRQEVSEGEHLLKADLLKAAPLGKGVGETLFVCV